MKKHCLMVSLLALFVAMTAGSCGKKGDVEITESEAEIKFDTLSHDFGVLPHDTTVVYEYLFHNIGATPLHLSGVSTSCGCTTADYPEGSIEPGESAALTVHYSTGRRKGRFNKSVRVYSNAKTGFVRLKVTGEVAD